MMKKPFGGGGGIPPPLDWIGLKLYLALKFYDNSVNTFGFIEGVGGFSSPSSPRNSEEGLRYCLLLVIICTCITICNHLKLVLFYIIYFLIYIIFHPKENTANQKQGELLHFLW